MLSMMTNTFLTGSSIAPVILIYALLALVERENLIGSMLILIFVALLSFCIFILFYSKQHLERSEFSFIGAEAADKESVAILLLYLAPLLETSVADLEWAFIIPASFLFLALVVTGYSFHFNPLLNILGWHFYTISTVEGITYTLITRKHLRKAGTKIVIGQLTRYTLLDVEEN